MGKAPARVLCPDDPFSRMEPFYSYEFRNRLELVDGSPVHYVAVPDCTPYAIALSRPLTSLFLNTAFWLVDKANTKPNRKSLLV